MKSAHAWKIIKPLTGYAVIAVMLVLAGVWAGRTEVGMLVNWKQRVDHALINTVFGPNDFLEESV